tara:strand:- start:1994 stop:2266 length:273 start_codon:yes stop_codon:yes gene_type:complete
MCNFKSHKTIFSALAFTLLSCKKDDICGLIIDKVIIENRYYFIFDSDTFNQFGGTDVNETIYYVPDNRSSGEISKEIYNDFNIGDEYCQS